MYKMAKTYNICITMNLNKKYVLKLLFLKSTAYIFAGIQMKLLLYTRSLANGSIQEQCP